jgi:DNA invertase Pin-like site-specific DNA recombinase
MKAFPYLRVSGKTQVEGDGPERQLEKIRTFCIRHDLPESVERTFDAGVSGTIDGLDRPALAELMTKMQPGDAIVVERMDRLARDLLVQELLLAECRKRNFLVYAADNELADMASNEGDPTRVLIRQILGAVAQWEKSVIVAKLKAGADKKRRETGRCGGVAPYGELPGEKEILAYLIEQHRIGESLASIAASANIIGFLTRSGKHWSKQRVHNAVARHTGAKL